MRSSLILRVVVSVLALSAIVRAADIPPRPRAPNDQAEYRHLVLDNGMKVILLSDPKLNKSSASVAIAAGSLAEPRGRLGLAHFLEHMLFLGTEKYPDESDYSRYLESNGGYSNAYTGGDHTNYHFEIRHEAFEGAIDRLSQFLIAPLFTAEFTEREMNAVNSEYQKNLESDAWREYQLRKTFYRPDHPLAQFTIGNRETLESIKREELIAWWKANYSANRMTLALTGQASLDQLDAWAREYFGPVANHDLPKLHYPADYLPPKAALRMAFVDPVKEQRQLTLEFPLPALEGFWASKPGELIGFILGYEGEGSLLSVLKAEGLAIGLSAGASADTSDYGTFDVGIDLTPAGLENYPRVLSLFFAAVEDMKQAGYPAYLFKERAMMARIDEMYRDKGEGAQRAVALANLIRDYPLEVAERVPYLWLEEDPAAYDEILGCLRPDNMLGLLMAKGLPTDSTERWFGTPYRYFEDTGEAYTSLLHPPKVAGLHLPSANPFIPARVSLLPEEPVQLIDEPALSLYFSKDAEFLRPMVTQIYRVHLPRSMATLENAALLTYYDMCVSEALNETSYTAAVAGLNFGLSASIEGVQITLSGYDASAPQLLDAVTAQLVDFKLGEERFAALKDRYLRGLRSFPRVDAWRFIMETRRSLVREFYYRPDELLPVAEKITLGDVQKFAQRLYNAGRIEALIHGNIGPTDAIAAARHIAGTLDVKAVSEGDLLERHLLVQAPGESVCAVDKLEGNNSAFRREYMLGDDSPEMRAATMALANFLSEPFYSEMRTHQQLGYIVFGGAGGEEHTSFAYFIIQSGEHPADEVEARADAFIETLPAMLAELPDEAWQMIVGGVRDTLLEKDKTIAERALRLFGLAYDEDGDWGRRDATLAALERLTRERTAEILAHALAPETRQVRTFLGFARQHKASGEQPPDVGDRGAWKATRTYE